MMRKARSTILICLAAAIAVMSAAVCYAYFTDYEEAKGGADVHLNGSSLVHEEADENGKVLQVENTGETDLLVRVGIYGDNITIDAPSEDWVEGSDGFWYYKKILEAGNTTSVINVRIDKAKADEAGHDFDIVVAHESVRVIYDGTEENRVVKPEGWLYPDIAVGMEEVSD